MPFFKSLIVAALLSCASATGLADGPASPVAVPPHRVIPVPPPPDAATALPSSATPSQPCFQTVVRSAERHAGKTPKHPKKQRSTIDKAPDKMPDMPPCQP